MSTPVARADARKRARKAANWGQYARKVGENAMEISFFEFLMFNSRCGGGCAERVSEFLCKRS